MATINSEMWTSDEVRGTTSPGARKYDTPGTGVGPNPPPPAHMGALDRPKGPKLNKSKRIELLKRYHQRIDAAKQFREMRGLDDKWKRMIALYQGQHFPNLLAGHDMIAVNICFSTINVILPAISVNYPKITVNARVAEQETQGVILEAVVNYWWRHYDVKPEFKLAVKDFLIIGHGWLKTGYRYVEQEEPVSDEDLFTAHQKAWDEVDSYIGENPDMVDSMPGPNDIAASIPETALKVTEDRPFAIRISPFDVYTDPEATHPQNMRWVAQKIVKSVEEVRSDAKYDRKARDDVQPDSHLMWREDDDMRSIDDDIKRVTIWEFYDLHTRTLAVFAENSEDFLVRPMWMPYCAGIPFEMIRNYEVPDQFYPMGELEAIEDLQMELDKTRTQMMNHRKRFAAKYIYDRAAFDQQGIAALESQDENAMIPANTNRPLGEVVVPLGQVSLPPEMYNQSEIIEHDLDRVTAVSEYQRGSMPEIRRTATEASIIQESANARSADKLAAVEDFIGRVAGRLVQLAQQYMTQESVVRVVGANGYPIWVPYDRDDIQGEYDFEVEGGSTQPVNETVRRQQAVNLLQAMTPFAEAGVIKIDELVKHALKYGFGVQQPDKFIAPPPDPEEQHGQDQAQKLVEQINYKDAPPDIQRQMEQAAGYEPSQQGGVSPTELADQKAQADQAKEAAKPVADPAVEAGKAQSQKEESEEARQHAAALEAQKHTHDLEKLGIEHAQKDEEMQAQREIDAQMAMQAGAPNQEPGQVSPEALAAAAEGGLETTQR